jgi:hypothetical protein
VRRRIGKALDRCVDANGGRSFHVE